MTGVADPTDVPDAPAAAVDVAPARRRVWLEHLGVRDFRNLERVELDVPAEGLAIIGENGHGKTNLLEAVYYLQLLRSLRGARDQDVVRFGAAGFHVAARVRGGGDASPHSQIGRAHV